MKQKRWATLQILFGVILSGAALYLALKGVSLRQVWQSMAQGNFLYIVLAILSVMANNLFKALRWQALLGERVHRANFSGLFFSLMSGQLWNLVYPVRMGDLSRIWVVGELGAGKAFVFGTLVVEKVLDTFAYGLLILVILFFIPLPTWLSGSAPALVALGIAAALLALYAASHRQWLDWLLARLSARRWAARWEGLRLKLEHVIRSGAASLDVLRQRGSLAALTGYTLLVWGTAVLNNFLILKSLNIPMKGAQLWGASALILIGLQAGFSLPSVPARIGIFEYICIVALQVFGIAQPLGLSYGILLHAVIIAPTLILGFMAFFFLGFPGHFHTDRG